MAVVKPSSIFLNQNELTVSWFWRARTVTSKSGREWDKPKLFGSGVGARVTLLESSSAGTSSRLADFLPRLYRVDEGHRGLEGDGLLDESNPAAVVDTRGWQQALVPYLSWSLYSHITLISTWSPGADNARVQYKGTASNLGTVALRHSINSSGHLRSWIVETNLRESLWNSSISSQTSFVN